MRAVALALFLAVALGWAVLSPSPAAADGNGVIAGQVVNRTASGGSVSGVEVQLHLFRGQGQQAQRATTAGPDGSFRFEGLDTSTDATYQVTVFYGGLPYGTGAIVFGPDQQEKTEDVEVFETTQENPGIYVESASLIIAGVDPESETVLALEIVELVNPSDRTYQPTPSGPQGPMGLVRFSLPPGATELTAHLGMLQEEVIQVDRGFASMAALPPGPREFMYGYRFPYKNGQVDFTKNLLYGAKVFTLLVVEGAGEVDSPQLTKQDAAEIQGNKYTHLQGNALAPNSGVQLTLSGLPQRSGLRLPFEEAPPGVWTGAGVALALATLAVMVLRRPTLSVAPTTPEPSALAQDIQGMLVDLAALDDRYEAGQLPEETYRTERDTLREQLKVLLREHDIHLTDKEHSGVDHEPGGKP